MYYLKRISTLLIIHLVLCLTLTLASRAACSDFSAEEFWETNLFIEEDSEDVPEATQEEENLLFMGDTLSLEAICADEDQVLDSQPLYDLLEEASQDAQEHAQGDNWFSSETDGQLPGDGKGGLSPTPLLSPSLTPAPTGGDLLSPTPLPRPDFTVEKKALVSSAKPGDTVIYTIKITNTGNVDLHSVLSTERFQGAGAKAYFEEQEGVTLNESRTQALVPKLAPGEEIVLTAYVIIPFTAMPQQLLNQVEVTTDETGPSIMSDETILPLVTPTPPLTQGYEQPAPVNPTAPVSVPRAQVQTPRQDLSPIQQTAPVQTGGSPSFVLALFLFFFSAAGLATILLAVTKMQSNS